MLNEIAKIIAPHRCIVCKSVGSLLCPTCIAQIPRSHSVCYRCNRLTVHYAVCRSCRSSSALSRVYSATSYQGAVKELVRRTKFTQARQGCDDMANLITQLVDLQIPKDALITYIPTATTRARQRGFDHSKLIAEELSVHLGLECAASLLRLRQVRQVGATRATRKQQVKGIFVAKEPIFWQKRPLVIVDDVLSTGATLEEAAKTLKNAGAGKVYGLVVARNK